MKTKLIALCSVSIFALAGCGGGIAVAPSVSGYDSNALVSTQDDFTTLALTSTNPDITKEIEAIKALPADQRKAKCDELLAKYPNDIKAVPGNGNMGKKGKMEGNKGFMGPGQRDKMMAGKKGGLPNLKGLETSNPDLAAALKTLRDLPIDQRHTKLEELKAKYPDAFKSQRILDLEKNYPDAAKELQAIQDEHQAKMDALRAKYPAAFTPQPRVVPSATPSVSASPSA